MKGNVAAALIRERSSGLLVYAYTREKERERESPRESRRIQNARHCTPFAIMRLHETAYCRQEEKRKAGRKSMKKREREIKRKREETGRDAYYVFLDP